jgi:hypothetical protein
MKEELYNLLQLIVVVVGACILMSSFHSCHIKDRCLEKGNPASECLK